MIVVVDLSSCKNTNNNNKYQINWHIPKTIVF